MEDTHIQGSQILENQEMEDKNNHEEDEEKGDTALAFEGFHLLQQNEKDLVAAAEWEKVMQVGLLQLLVLEQPVMRRESLGRMVWKDFQPASMVL